VDVNVEDLAAAPVAACKLVLFGEFAVCCCWEAELLLLLLLAGLVVAVCGWGDLEAINIQR